MALNPAVFRTRTLTALVFAAVMLTGLLWNQWSFLLLFSIIHFGCWREFLQLTEKIKGVSFHVYSKLGFSLMGYGGMLLFCGSRFTIGGYPVAGNIFLPLTIAGFVLLVAGLFLQPAFRPATYALAALGWIYISLSFGLLVSLWQNGISWCSYDSRFITRLPLVVVVSIWVNDTMAYIVGSLIGKTPLSKISPKKTWEGTAGGVILSVIVTGLLFPMVYTGAINWPLPLFYGLIAGVAAVSGTCGDLLESKLKRLAGVKDSGSFLPGHGGFLDRFDSLLLATPAVWLCLKLMTA